MTLVCAVNDLPDLRPCTIGGEHAAHCDGQATRWDADLERRVTTDRECKGCLPTPAEHGMLCFSCWEKLRDGLTKAVDVITHLRSVEKAAQADNAGVRSPAGWVLPVPTTWRTADDLIVILGHPTPGFPSDAGVWEVEAIAERYVDAIEPLPWVSTVAGAHAAARFNATMYAALIQHPMEDYEHKIRNVHCPECMRRSLLWKPPLMFKGEIRVTCTNPECGFVVDQTGYAKLTARELFIVKAKIADEKKRKTEEHRAIERAAKKAAKEVTKAEAKAAAARESSDSERGN